MSPRARQALLPLVLPGLCLAAWAIAGRAGVANPRFLPPPDQPDAGPIHRRHLGKSVGVFSAEVATSPPGASRAGESLPNGEQSL
jgi:hypothetical protein